MSLNPVERRLVYLCAEWIRFRENPSARLLIWQVPENAFRLVECFVEAQKQESDYASGDLFLLFKTPYEHSMHFSQSLQEALRGQYDASRAQLEAEGLPTDWDFDPATSARTPAAFVAALRSFGAKYHRSIGHLVVVLLPAAIADETAFTDWMLRVLATHLPERLRFLLIDSVENPRYRDLINLGDPRIEIGRPQVDGFSVAQETFAQEPVTGPAGVFRNLLIGLAALTEKGSAEQVKAKARDALTFVRKQQWLDQEVVLWLMVAGALLKENRHDEAVQVYQGARKVAVKVAEQAHPAGNKLILQTWFGEAAALLAKGDAADASFCYDEASLVAQRDRNVILGIEAFRMGAFCLARIGDVDGALERGRCAHELAEPLKPEVRLLTTLPLAGVDLLLALDPERVAQMEQVKSDLEIRSRLAKAELERSAGALGGVATAETESAIEQRYQTTLQNLKIESAGRLDRIISSATPQFQQQFARSSHLLGDDWPLFSETGLMASVQGREGSAV